MALAPRFHTVIAGPARKNDPQVIEAIMAAAVKPGSLVMLDSTGKLAVHNVAGGAGVARRSSTIISAAVISAMQCRPGILARPSCAKTMSITTCW